MHTTIKSLGSLDAGELIPSLQVRIKKAWMPDRGQSGQRKWKRQSAIGQDKTGEIRMTFWNHDRDLRDLEGNDITITSGDERGIKTIDYENQKSGVVERQISVEKEAVVDEVVDTGLDADKGEGQPVIRKTKPVIGNGPAGKAEPQRIRVYEDETVKRASIERQAALAQAVIYGNDIDGITPDMIVGTAEVFYRFLANKVTVPYPTPALTVPEQAEEAPDGDSEIL